MQFPFPIMVLVTCIAALGFALFFNVNKKHLFSVTLGGVLTWTIYYVVLQHIGEVFIPCFIASIFAAVYAEIMSRLARTPVAVYFVIAVIPLIPGRVLYYTMYNAVSGNLSDCFDYGITTINYACGIAFGICLVTAVVQTWERWAADKAKRLARMLRKQTKRKPKPEPERGSEEKQVNELAGGVPSSTPSADGNPSDAAPVPAASVQDAAPPSPDGSEEGASEPPVQDAPSPDGEPDAASAPQGTQSPGAAGGK